MVSTLVSMPVVTPAFSLIISRGITLAVIAPRRLLVKTFAVVAVMRALIINRLRCIVNRCGPYIHGLRLVVNRCRLKINRLRLHINRRLIDGARVAHAD